MRNLNLINLTGHDVTMLNENLNQVLTIPSSGVVRLEEEIAPAGTISAEGPNGSSITIHLTRKSYGGTELPLKKEDVIYIVSLAVAQYAKDLGRNDFIVPSEIQRSEDRRTILGARSLGLV